MIMKNLIPFFIAKNLSQRKYNGQFLGYSIFLDISGFTSMTERLMKEGKTGAEVISNILDDVFSPIVDSIHSNNGFVASFLGDAINAIFFENSSESVITCLNDIKNIMKSKKIQRTNFGNFRLSAKIGVSFGNICWGISGTDNHKSYYFTGEAIDKSIENEKNCKKMQIVTDKQTLINISKFIKSQKIQEIKKEIRNERFDKKDRLHNIKEEIKKEFYSIDEIVKIKKEKEENEQVFITSNIIKIFFPDELIKYNYKGEFREIVSVFISIKNQENHNKIDKIIKTIISKTDDFQGYFNKIDFTDKGFTAVIFFGFPIAYEDNIKRALNYILSIKNELTSEIRAGITFGTAFSGLIGNNTRCEYTCLGDIVNLSARLMSKARSGEIWVTKLISDKLKNYFKFEQIGYRKFKGKNEKIEVFKLLEEKKENQEENSFFIPMIGREEEYNKLDEYIKSVIDTTAFKILYIYGEAGIGKSRIIYEITKKYEEKFNFFILQTDSIVKKSFNPFINFLKKYFNQDTSKNEKENKINFEKKYQDLLDKLKRVVDNEAELLIKELIRTKSFIAALIGIYYENSPYKLLDPKGRYENTLYAIKDFFLANSLIKPTIFICEDLHWIDYDSGEEFKILTRNIKKHPIRLVVTSRFNDDGSKPYLMVDEDILKEEININHLSKTDSEQLIDIELGNKSDTKLKDVIIVKTLGNPFYIEQFCQYLIENNLLKISKNGYELNEKNIEIPSSINSIIMARIDRLSLELKEAVQLASVIGMEFELEILNKLIDELMSDSYEDSNNQIIYECEKQKIWISLSEIKYIFKHALLQQVAYEMQLQQRLILVHNLIGKIMEELFINISSKHSEIAYHYDKGKNYKKAIEYFEKSAEFYKFNYNNNEAIFCYDRLLNLLESKEKKIEILNNKGYILELMGQWDEAEKCYKKSLDISSILKNEKLICKSKELIASLLISKGNYEQALNLLSEAQIIAEKNDDKRQYSFILKDYGNIYSNQGEYDKALQYFEKMKEICTNIDDKLGYSIAIESIGNVFADKGHYEIAMQYYKEKKDVCQQIGDKRGYSIAVGNMGLSYHYRGDLENAIKCYEERKKICFEIGDRTGYSIAVGNIGNIYRDKFDFNNSIKCYEEIKEIFLSMGDKRRYSIAIGNIGNLFLTKGDFENALNNFELQKEICHLIADKRGYVTAISNIGKVYDLKEEYDMALSFYDQAIELAKTLNLDYHLSDLLRKKAELLYEIGQIDKSTIINEEALKVSKTIENAENIFDGYVLKNKIEKNCEGLLSLLKDADEEEKKASIYYSLFKIAQKDSDKIQYRNYALEFYQSLYQKTGFFYFHKKLKELEN